VVRKRRSGKPDHLLQITTRHPILPGTNECSVDLQPDGAADRFKLARGYFEFHRNKLLRRFPNCKRYFYDDRNKFMNSLTANFHLLRM